MNLPKINLGDKLVCPVCNKEFKASSDTAYIANGGYTCGWKCFVEHTKDARNKKK